MGKLATAAVVGVSGAGAAVGGIYLSGLFSTMDATLPTTLDDFKSKGAKGCIDHLFPNLNLSDKGSSIDSQSKVDANTFNSENSKPGVSCLTVNWDKEIFASNNPGQGNFRWLGSLVRGDKGFIMFILASPSTTTEKELSLSGVFYLLTRDDKNVWKIEKNKDLNPSKKINKTDFDSVFPKVGSTIKKDEKLKDDYWGFVSGANDMDNACKNATESACTGNPTKITSFKGLGLVNSFDEQGNEIKKWSENVDSGLSQIYTSSEIDLSGFLGSLKGEWKLQVYSSKTQSPT